MAATPVLLLADEMIRRRAGPETPDYEMPPGDDDHVIIAGFGRFGQIVARILRARQIPFTALDSSVEQVDFVKSFGSRIYYGGASRTDILRAAETQKARAFVLAINDVEDSLRVAVTVRQNFPDVPIYARARDRTHVHRLMDLGVTIIERETFLSALELTRKLLKGLGLGEAEVRRLTESSSVSTRSDSTRTINITRISRRSAPTRSRKQRSSRNSSPATWRSFSCPRRRLRSLAPSGEMAGDQPVHLGRMGERTHMARAFQHRHCGVRQRRAQHVDHGAGRDAGLAADDQQCGSRDAFIVA
jgi:voltage-gated potassium channel Kch